MRTSVGIDVGKEELEVFIGSTEESRTYKNSRKARKSLIKLLGKLAPEIIVFENTGSYHRELMEELEEKGLPMLIANPKRVRDFARGLGKLAKNDKVDAQILCWYGEKSDEPPTTLPSHAERELRDLSARRDQLNRMIIQEKNRLSELPSSVPEVIRASIESVLDSFEQELEALDCAIAEVIQSDPELSQKSELLQSIKGVGEVVSAALISHMPELGTLSKREVASLAGVAPFDHDSGKFSGQRKIFGGRNPVRAALYMAILSATRFCPPIRDLYLRLIEKGKKKKVAQVACMRKLIVILNAMLRDNATWYATDSLQA